MVKGGGGRKKRGQAVPTPGRGWLVPAGGGRGGTPATARRFVMVSRLDPVWRNLRRRPLGAVMSKERTAGHKDPAVSRRLPKPATQCW